MALNMKVALLTCLGFIGGISWLVNQVARPMVAAPAPLLVVTTPDAPQAPLPVAARTGAHGLAGQFANASATDQPDGSNLDTSPLAVALIESGGVLIDEAPQVAPAVPAEPRPLPPIAAALPGAPSDAPNESRLATPRQENVPLAVLASGSRIVDGPEAKPAPIEREALPAGKSYRVRRGDTIVRLLRREWHRADPEAIAAFLAVNPRIGQRKGYTIRIGEKLLIPDIDTALAYRDAKLAEAGTQVAAGRRAPAGRRRRVYTVRRHDTLVKIAREKLNDAKRWTEIAKLNGLKNADNIRPGTEILLPEPSGSET